MLKHFNIVKGRVLMSAVLGTVAAAAGAPATQPVDVPVQPFHQLAPTPPMGWNSWDCFGTTVTEDLTKANTDYMAEHLASHGYQYIVVDIQWYEPNAIGHDYRKGAALEMDENGRLLPAVKKFPSAADGKGFKPLADYVHSKGLKFGIHLMRGIPRQAVTKNTPLLGTDFKAADIANVHSTCKWNPDMYGVDMTKPGAQAYYNSVFNLIASWGVDFVKVDDLSRPYADHIREVEAIRTAIDQSGRPMVLSTSPGETPLDQAMHVAEHANMWRISDDFWDHWPALLEQFGRCAKWAPYTGPGHWPDADMLPVGAVRMDKDRKTNFTHDEQYTLITLWSMCRSPLMIGGHMPLNDDFTLALLTNDEVLAVNQHSTGGHELFRKDGLVAWVADVPDSRDRYVALFNTLDKPKDSDAAGAEVAVDLNDIGFTGPCAIRDLWSHKDLGGVTGRYSQTIPWHGAALLRIHP
jgi:hypothetical protein